MFMSSALMLTMTASSAYAISGWPSKIFFAWSGVVFCGEKAWDQ